MNLICVSEPSPTDIGISEVIVALFEKERFSLIEIFFAFKLPSK